MQIKIYSGGLVDTNAFLLDLGGSHWLIDAPEGTAEFLSDEGVRLDGLVLTHGHWDHIWDAASVLSEHQCPVYGHAADLPLFRDPNIMAAFGLPVKLEPVELTRTLNDGEFLEAGNVSFQILHVPGHCPGSIALHDLQSGILFGGDVLFAGGVGRWDLPGGDLSVLMASIRDKILPLPDAVKVYPGHGPATTVGQERRSNPFLNR